MTKLIFFLASFPVKAFPIPSVAPVMRAQSPYLQFHHFFTQKLSKSKRKIADKTPMSTQTEISKRWQRKKLQCPKQKKNLQEIAEKKLQCQAKKSGKLQKPTPGASSSLHIQYLTSGSFYYKKQALTPKQIQEGKEKKNTHTLHGSRKTTKRLKRREENHQQQKKKKTKTLTEMGADDDGDGFM